MEALGRRVDNMVFSHEKRGRRRPKRTWEDVVKNNPIINNVPHIANPTLWDKAIVVVERTIYNI